MKYNNLNTMSNLGEVIDPIVINDTSLSISDNFNAFSMGKQLLDTVQYTINM